MLGDLESRVSRLTEAFMEAAGIDFARGISLFRRHFIKWVRDVVDRLITLGVYFCFTIVLCVVLLFTAKTMWYLYLQLPVGKQFQIYYPETVGAISRITDIPAFDLVFDICRVAVLVCVGVGAAARLFFVGGWFYTDRGMVLRFLVWPACCSFAVAWLMSERFDLTLQAGALFVFLPCMFLCHPCFRIVFRCLPELNVMAFIKKVPLWFAKSREIVKQIGILTRT